MNKPTHQILAQACQRAKHEKTDCDKEVEFLHVDMGDYQIIAIRATEADAFFSGRGWVDVVRDLAIWPKKHGKATGHAGFINGWHAIYDEVAAILSQRPQKPTYLTGHSLGGAIAMVGAYSLIQSDYNLVEVVTFGAPRALNMEECNLRNVVIIDMKATQYQNIKDPVPGYLKWTDYHHINTTLVGGKKRKGWFSRKWRFHDLNDYERAVGKLL